MANITLDLDRDFYIVLDADGDIREMPHKLFDLAGAVQMAAELDWRIAGVLTLNPVSGTSREASLETAETIAAKLFEQNAEPHPMCAVFLDKWAVDYPSEESVSARQSIALRHARAA